MGVLHSSVTEKIKRSLRSTRFTFIRFTERLRQPVLMAASSFGTKTPNLASGNSNNCQTLSQSRAVDFPPTGTFTCTHNPTIGTKALGFIRGRVTIRSEYVLNTA
eukprot:m.73735 g.73735  ORF g.73735 m.73735 type:complete len:105 (-) comp10244_c0_seq1:709-1023(-)